MIYFYRKYLDFDIKFSPYFVDYFSNLKQKNVDEMKIVAYILNQYEKQNDIFLFKAILRQLFCKQNKYQYSPSGIGNEKH